MTEILKTIKNQWCPLKFPVMMPTLARFDLVNTAPSSVGWESPTFVPTTLADLHFLPLLSVMSLVLRIGAKNTGDVDV